MSVPAVVTTGCLAVERVKERATETEKPEGDVIELGRPDFGLLLALTGRRQHLPEIELEHGLAGHDSAHVVSALDLVLLSGLCS